jgi:hypothetical protein
MASSPKIGYSPSLFLAIPYFRRAPRWWSDGHWHDGTADESRGAADRHQRREAAAAAWSAGGRQMRRDNHDAESSDNQDENAPVLG